MTPCPKKINRIYNIEQESLAYFVNFSKKTGLSQTSLLNYAWMLNEYNQISEKRISTSLVKKRKGLEFTHSSLLKLDTFNSKEREQVLTQMLGTIPDTI